MRHNIEEADKVLLKKYPVLDHGYVSLVDYMGGDKAIEDCARVSYGKGTRKLSDTRGLLRYLIRHNHTSPLEQSECAFNIAMPIHVARQFFRHRTMNFNEYSGRYSEVPDVLYEEYDFKLQSKSNKQGREESVVFSANENKTNIAASHRKAFEIYKDLLNMGVAREQARMHLPLNTYTYFTAKCDLNNLFKFLRLRLDSHAQHEIRQYANIMACLAQKVAPLAFEAFVNYQLESFSISKLEYQVIIEASKCGINLFDNQTLNTLHGSDIESRITEIATNIGLVKSEISEFYSKLHGPTNYTFVLPEPLLEE